MTRTNTTIFPGSNTENVVNYDAYIVCEADTSLHENIFFVYDKNYEFKRKLESISTNMENFTVFLREMRNKINHGR